MSAGYYPWQGTPGSVTISAQVTALDGTSYSAPVQTTKDASGFGYNAFAQSPAAIITLSTKDATQQNGVYTLRHDLPAVKGTFSATMGNFHYDDVSGAGDGAWAGLVAQANYALDPHQLWISSDIEPSYGKVDGASTIGPSLPYTVVPDSSSPTGFTTIVDQTKLNPLTPYYLNYGLFNPIGSTNPPDYWNGPVSKGPWGVFQERKPDGSMQVDTVAAGQLVAPEQGSPFNSDGALQMHWTRTGKLTANTVGFVNPTFKWNTSVVDAFGTHDFGNVKSIDVNGVGMHWGSFSGDTKNYSVTVTDSPSGVASTNSYTVTYHAPLENIETTTKTTNRQYDDGASSWTPFNRSLEVKIRNGQIGITFDTAQQWAAGVDKVFGAAGMNIKTAVAVDKLGYAITGQSAIPSVEQKTFSYDEYAQAVRREVEIQANGGNSYHTFFPLSDLSTAAATLTDNGHVENDSYWMNHQDTIQGRVVVSMDTLSRQHAADLYDARGFEGKTTYYSTASGAPLYVWQVRVGANTSTEQPKS